VTFRLAEPEARVLEAFCRRQLAWDSRTAARVLLTPTALGLFTVPPLGVFAFMAVPVAGSATPADITVPLAALADVLGSEPDGEAIMGLPRAIVPPAPAPNLHQLPPSDGWQLPIPAISGDLVPVVTAATGEFAARSAGLPPRAQQEIAEEIWQRPGFGGLPLRALHAARQLGMLPDDMSKVTAATNGAWRRLSTNRGQVFTYAAGPAARLALHVVR
jgi:hypothetical protein